jgi:phosphoribosylformylglycinamidine synthase
VVLRYRGEDALGSTDHVAGVANAAGNVLGLMPHPEDHIEAALGSTDGRGLFAGLVDHLEQAA